MKTQAIFNCFVGARGAAGGYAVSIGRDCLVGREDLWDSGAATGGFRSGFHLGSELFSRCGHAREFTYNYVKMHPEHPAPHDLSASQSEAARSECVVIEEVPWHYPSACLIQQAQTSSFNFTNFTNLMTIASVVSKPAPALGSSSFITDATGYATQHLQYLPFGETFVDQQNGYDARYTFSAKEKDDETQYSYFGARYYDSDLSVWLSVDPMSDKYPWISPYAYVNNNPVMLNDPDGRDWFIDEETNSLYYNSRIGKDNMDELKGTEYENYKWFGENEMFGYTEEQMRSSASDPDGFIAKTADYASTLTFTNGEERTNYDVAHFSGENTEKFMKAMGYDLKPMNIEYTYYFMFKQHPDGFQSTDSKTTITKEENFKYVESNKGVYETKTAEYGDVIHDPVTNTTTSIIYKTAVFNTEGKMLPGIILNHFNIDQRR